MFFTKPGRYRVFIFDIKRMAVFTVLLISTLAGILWSNSAQEDNAEIISKTEQLAEKLQELSVRDEENLVAMRALTAFLQRLAAAMNGTEQNLREEISKLKESNEVLRDHARLLGILQNENNAAILAGRPQDIIFISRDWTIDRMPRYLSMSIQDVEWLSRFVNKEGSAVSPPTPSVPN